VLGAGVHLLLLGLGLEAATVVVWRWVSFPWAISLRAQLLLTAACMAVCVVGMIWFNRSLDLVEQHLRDGDKTLVTDGPFNYVRHPLYSTLLFTVPPLFVIWASDFLFLLPWILILASSHFVVYLEERGLVETFGEEYEAYRRYVPALIPYKGRAGRRYREESRPPMLDKTQGLC
jgi:protein-S-isoprenylcysteine O-methyltransferase Ste14